MAQRSLGPFAPGTRKESKRVSRDLRPRGRGNFNRYTKRPLQDSAMIFSTPEMGKSAFHCANHMVSCKCQQPPGWKIHRFYRWKMPFAVFRSGSGVPDSRDLRPRGAPESPKSRPGVRKESKNSLFGLFWGSGAEGPDRPLCPGRGGSQVW